MNTTTKSIASRQGAVAARTVLPQRTAPTPLLAPRQPFRVLQTGHAPAQLSLFLRPAGLGPR